MYKCMYIHTEDAEATSVFHRTWKTLTYRTMNSGGR